MSKIVINSIFQKLIPPLAPEEKQQLESNLIADGCRDPIVLWQEQIVDGHNRYEICRRHSISFRITEKEFKDQDEACVWIIRNQFGRRNLAPYTRVELALKLEPLLKSKVKEKERERKTTFQKSEKSSLPKANTTKDLAKVAGVSHDTIAKGKLVAEHADEETKDRLRRNQVSVHRVAKDIKEKLQQEKRAADRNESAKGATLNASIIVGDFREKGWEIPNGSLSLIFTDPPYDRKASSMLPDLGKFASEKLADGGSLICYVGQTQIPAALDALRLHLRYWWTIACIHAGKSTVMREYGINAGWKAVLWFVKGTRDNPNEFVSDVMSGGQEKDHHDWQQSESEAAYWIEKLCPVDGIICDPFLGGGTTAAAAKALKRKWVAFEIEKDNAMVASKRLE